MDRLYQLLTCGLAAGCAGPYREVAEMYRATSDMPSQILESQRIVIAARSEGAAVNFEDADIGLSNAGIQIRISSPFGLLYPPVEVPLGAISGCSATCFGESTWNVDVLLEKPGADGLGGLTLGLITGLFGPGAIAATTVAVERVVLRHLEQQMSVLQATDPSGAAAISAIVADERAHHDRSLVHARASRFWSAVLMPIVAAATEAVIWTGMRV